MEPVTTSIATALAAGAWAVFKSTAEQAVKDAYASLKALIKRKYAKVNVDQLETKPSSKSRRGVVEEDLKAAGADRDTEVLQHAQVLLKAIQRQSPQMVASIGVDLKEIEGAALVIRRVIATGTGIKVEQGKFSGDITIEDVQAGGMGGARPNA